MQNKISYDITVTNIVIAHKKVVSKYFKSAKLDRPDCGIAYIIKGSAKYNTPEGAFNVREGNTVIFKKGDTYSFVSNNCEFIIINFHTDKDELFNSLGYVLDTDPLSAQLFRQIEERWNLHSFGYRILAKAELLQILYNCFYDTLHIKKQSRLDPAIEYIYEYFDTNIKISTLADICAFSEPHFRRIFHSMYGITPTQFINKVRVTKAKALISTSLYSIGDIAVMCGFKNIYYFSRKFKEITGASPKEFE